jgi:hypothetical protein
MPWTDIVSIVFVCVTINHMGLVSAIEQTIGRDIPILNCPKCCTFWCVLLYSCGHATTHITMVLAISFLCSYLAIWLELLEAYIDTLYMKCYEKITEGDSEREAATDADKGNSKGTVPKL